PRSDDVDTLAEQLPQHLREDPRHRALARLDLPTPVAGPIVLERELEVSKPVGPLGRRPGRHRLGGSGLSEFLPRDRWAAGTTSFEVPPGQRPSRSSLLKGAGRTLQRFSHSASSERAEA